jgi:hypothetical protein
MMTDVQMDDREQILETDFVRTSHVQIQEPKVVNSANISALT